MRTARISNHLSTLAASFATLTLVAGCTVSAGEGCDVDSDCGDGLVCNMYSLVCTPPDDVCESTRDCADPARPFCGPQNICVAALDDGAADAGPTDGGPTDTGAPDVTTGRDAPVGRDRVARDLSGDVTANLCPAPAETMLRVTTLEIGLYGTPDHGMDVDDDADTCAPMGGQVPCRDGVDNALAPLAFLANAQIEPAIRKRDLNTLLTPEPPTADGGCFVLLSRFAAATQAADDSWSYAIEPRGETAPCAEGAAFVDACLDGGALTGGFDADATFPLVIPLFGVPLEVPVRQARVVGTVTTGGGGAWRGFDGLVAGVVHKDEFDALLASVPTEELPPGTDLQVMVYDQVGVTPDIDTDGDGTDDAISVGLHIVAEPVAVTGFAEAE